MYESSETNVWLSFQELIKVSLWTILTTLQDHKKANLNNQLVDFKNSPKSRKLFFSWPKLLLLKASWGFL